MPARLREFDSPRPLTEVYMNTEIPKKLIIVALSGGLDSAYLLKYICEHHPDSLIEAHHVILGSSVTKNRTKFENIASEIIVAYYRKKYNREICYSTSISDYQQFCPWDFDAVAFNIGAGVVRKRYVSGIQVDNKWFRVNPIILAGGRCKEDNNTFPSSLKHFKLNISEKIWQAATEAYRSKAEPVIYRPLLNMSKGDMLKNMTAEEFYMTSSCRKPSSNGVACGKCHACKNVKAGLEESGKEEYWEQKNGYWKNLIEAGLV